MIYHHLLRHFWKFHPLIDVRCDWKRDDKARHDWKKVWNWNYWSWVFLTFGLSRLLLVWGVFICFLKLFLLTLVSQSFAGLYWFLTLFLSRFFSVFVSLCSCLLIGSSNFLWLKVSMLISPRWTLNCIDGWLRKCHRLVNVRHGWKLWKSFETESNLWFVWFLCTFWCFFWQFSLLILVFIGSNRFLLCCRSNF